MGTLTHTVTDVRDVDCSAVGKHMSSAQVPETVLVRSILGLVHAPFLPGVLHKGMMGRITPTPVLSQEPMTSGLQSSRDGEWAME